jgi:hypothetical protein
MAMFGLIKNQKMILPSIFQASGGCKMILFAHLRRVGKHGLHHSPTKTLEDRLYKTPYLDVLMHALQANIHAPCRACIFL